MPSAVETPVKAYAHCRWPLCPGYGQEEVPAVKTETSYTFADHGENGPLRSSVFRSFSELRFAVDADVSDREAYIEQYREAAACKSCGNPRELADQARPQYVPSGYDPMGLVNGTVAQFNPSVVNTPGDEKVAALEATVNKQAAMLAALMNQLGVKEEV